ncbi:MAG: hypothetical protein ABWK53_09535 [Anaerolineales bacterium]
MSADILLGMLVVFLAILYLMAMSYLRRRSLTPRQFLIWGLVALVLPALGPFLVIAFRPGTPRRPAGRPKFRREEPS